MKVNVNVELSVHNEVVVANMHFSDTGEIRQKRMSFKYVAKRLFLNELKTRRLEHNEIITIDKVSVIAKEDFKPNVCDCHTCKTLRSVMK